MAKLILTFLIGLLTGCAAPSAPLVPANSSVRPATAEQVRACEYLDDVIGTSGFYGVFASQGVENARAETLNKAVSIGATHVVWQSSTVSYGSTSVAGKAYKCKN